MIKIYDKTDINDLSNSENLSNIVDVGYNFYEDNKDIYCEVFIQYSGDPELDTNHASFQTVINKEIYRGQIIMISLYRESQLSDRFTKIAYSAKYNKLSGTLSTPRDLAKFNAATVWIPYDVNEPIIILPQIRTKPEGNRIEGLDYEEIELVNKDTAQLTLFTLSEDAKMKKDLWELKKQYISDLIDPYETITYLEGQVDVLSKVINIILDKTGIDAGEYKEILKTIDDNNVISVKPLDRINSELLTSKHKVRNLQKEYYIKRYA